MTAETASRLDQEMDAFWNTVGTGDEAIGLGADPAVTDPDEAAATQPVDPEAQQRLIEALDEFDQAIEQYGQSTQTEQVQSQMAQLRTQSDMARQQLETDPQGAMESIERLTQAAMTLPQAELSAEARNIHDRPIISSDGQEVGQVGGLLVTADGRVEAVIIGRSGALGLGNSQRVVAWDQIQIQGEQIMVNLTEDQVEQLPEYVVD